MIKYFLFRKSAIIETYLSAMIGLSVVSFLPIFRLGMVPVGLLLIFPIACWLLFDILANHRSLDKFEITYFLYVITSIPSLLLGLFEVGLSSFYVFVYSSVVIIVSLAMSFSKVRLKIILWLLFVVLTILTILGWVFRIGILDPSIVFEAAESSELLVGYWGIRYSPSTRNADYFYPLFAVLLANILITKTTVRNFVTLIFLGTVVLSLSRAGLISSILIGIVFWKEQGVIRGFINIVLPLLFVVFLGIKAEIIGPETLDVIVDIFNSILEVGSRFSNNDRKEILFYTLREIVLHPFGTGIDNFHLPGLNTASAENAFFTVLLERGWVSGFLFMSVLLRMISIEKIWKSKVALTMMITAIYLTFNYELNNLSMSVMLGVIFSMRKSYIYGERFGTML